MRTFIARRLGLGSGLVTVLCVAGCGGNGTTPPSAPSPLTSAASAQSDLAHARPKPGAGQAPKQRIPAGASASRKAASRPGQSGSGPSGAPPSGPAIDSTALEHAIVARFAHRPLAEALARRTRNPDRADRAAQAVVREAERLRMSPSLLGAVLLIENRALDSSAVSGQGAVGLMQVMPMHAGSYGCSSSELREVDANICHGARLLHRYLVRSRSVAVALRRYNGCVRGANTPRCERYPARVLRTASRLRADMLANAADMGLIVPASVSVAPRTGKELARAGS